MSVKILLIFVDGLGVGENNRDVNPLVRHPGLWPTATGLANSEELSFTAIDACLGVEGLPQSATGQTALLTGVNAPEIVGRHLQGFPSRKLIEVLQRDSLFVRLKKCGVKATFANAYRHPEDIGPASRLSVTSHAFKSGGQPFRSVGQISQGEALYHDFTNRSLKHEGYEVPRLSPEKAAGILVAIARRHAFTLYEHFLTDIVGHRGKHDEIARQIDLLSRFMETVLRLCKKDGINLVITSDHGNVEDNRIRTHTRNPVPLLWSTTPAIAVDPLPKEITEITPWLLRLLRCER